MAKKRQTKRNLTAQGSKTTGSKASRKKSPPTNARSAQPTVAEPVETAESRVNACPVVGIGASAGGLDAFKRFFATLPADSGMVFVLVQHLDPTHESFTAELLAQHTSMPVTAVEDDMPVEPNHVYVIPPNTYLTISGEEAAPDRAD